MATNNMHNLTTLIKRLEAATLRLEDIASSTIELPQAVPALQQTLATPEAGTSPVPGVDAAVAPPPPAPPVPEEPLPESIDDFDLFLNGSVQTYAKASEEIGGLVATQSRSVVRGFHAMRNFLLITTKAKKPDLTGADMSLYQDLLKPINEALMETNELKDANRGSPDFALLSAVSDGIMVLAWVTVDSKPYKQVEECLGSAEFWGNRVIKDSKEKEPNKVEWIRAFYQIFKDLSAYIKNYFPNGILWNPNGQPAAEVAKSLAGVSAPRPAPPPPPPAPGGAGGPPPPPPPPPPPGPPPVLEINDVKAPPAGSSAAGGLGAVFSELNKGEAVTKGLRKVDKSEMTHKNPSLRAGSTVPDGEAPLRGKSPAPGKKPKPESMRVKKPSKKELEGNKWTIENFDKDSGPIEIEASISHSVLISKCSNATVIIKGKANAVTVENTTRLALVVDSLVSSVDAVKSANFALQVLGAVPTVMLDQIDGAQIYFSRESVATRVYSSKSAGINLNVLPGADADEDYKEVPLPSQICSYWDAERGELVNEIVSHAG